MVTQHNGSEKTIDVVGLKDAVKQVPKFKAVMEYVATGRDRSREEMAFPTLKRQKEMRKVKLEDKDMEAIFEALQATGVGIKMRSQGKTTYFLFKWLYNMKDVALLALGERLPEGRVRPPTHRLEMFEQLKAAQHTAVELNMQKSGYSEQVPAKAAPPAATDPAEVNIVRAGAHMCGQLVEIEIDLNKVPKEAFVSVKFA